MTTARARVPALGVLGAAALLAAPPTPLAAALPAGTGEDTVIAVQRGQVLVGDGFSGWVTVEAGAGDRVELIEESGEGGVTLRVLGNRLVLQATGGRRRGARSVRLRVPAWLPVQLRGGALTASVDGLTQGVELTSVEGDLTLRNVGGDVFARTVEGAVVVEGATGRLRLRSVEEGVRVARADAESVLVESTSGDLWLEDVTAGTVDATTTDGDIAFAGDLRASGAYRFATHDGDLTVAIPADADALVSVSTFDGEFLPEFPITIDRLRGGKEMVFTLGRGGARLTLTAFDGDIVLRRR